MTSEESIAQLLLDRSAERSTKARILDASIDLFAQKGFDAVSMQEIADAVGIKKASLYYHFTSKDQILESILGYPMELLGVVGPENAGAEEQIVAMGLEGFMDMSQDVVLKWLESPYVEKIMRIIFVELYHNDQVKSFWSGFVGAAETFWEDNFAIMAKHGLIRPVDARALAGMYLSYYSHAWIDFFLHRYGSAASSFREEHGDGLDRHTRFLVDLVRAGV